MAGNDGDDGRSSLPKADQVQLICLAASELKDHLRNGDGRLLLDNLAQPLSDGPYANRLEELMAKVADGLDVKPELVCAVFTLLLLRPLMRSVQEQGWCPHCQPGAAVFASSLRLAQPRIWLLAADQAMVLTPDKTDAEFVKAGLLTVQQQLYADAHPHQQI